MEFEKVDVFMFLIGAVAFIYFLYEGKRLEWRLLKKRKEEEMAKRQREYEKRLVEERKRQQQAMEHKMRQAEEMAGVAKAMETLQSFENQEVMKKTRVTHGQVG